MSVQSNRIALLVVDDDEVDRAAVRRALRSGGVAAEVTEASDFASAKKALLAGTKLDVVLLDFHLPGGDGLEILQEAHQKGIDTPIIVLTGAGDEALAVELMKAGAADYLPKNLVTPERLAQSVRQVLRLRDSDRRTRDARSALERQAGQLQRLADASIGIHGAQTLDEALDFISRTARELIGANVAVAQLDGVEGRGAVERRALSQKYRPYSGAALDEADLRFATLVQESRKSVRFSQVDLEADPAWTAACARRFQGVSVRGLLAAPLVGREGKPVGSLQLTDRMEGDFDASDEAILVQLAQTASVALENARLYRAAQQATSTRDDVLAIVSHDLRNPLNVVGMSAAMLRSTVAETPAAPPRGGVLALVERIERNVARMNRLIEDLLDASQVDSGKLSVRLQPERASALLTDAVESALPLAESQGTRLETGALDAALVVKADRDRILQLLSNLVGNALKFVPREGGRIRLSVAADGARACFSITDNGPGIPADHLEHLFERYWRGSASRRDGAGLGLFIAKGIVDAHRGEIRVESEPGKGTTVRFWLLRG
jgi:signal transduction histidine kinase